MKTSSNNERFVSSDEWLLSWNISEIKDVILKRQHVSFYDPLIFELLKMLRAYSPACRRRRINPIKCVQLSTGSRNKATSAQSWNRRITLKISPLFIRLVAYPTTDSRTFKVHFIEINNPYKSSLNGFANNVCLRQTLCTDLRLILTIREK